MKLGMKSARKVSLYKRNEKKFYKNEKIPFVVLRLNYTIFLDLAGVRDKNETNVNK